MMRMRNHWRNSKKLLGLGVTAIALSFAVPGAGYAQDAGASSGGSGDAGDALRGRKPAPGSTETLGSQGLNSSPRPSGTMDSSGQLGQVRPGERQDGQMNQSQMSQDQMGPNGQLLMGKDVYGANDQEVGQVDDVVIDQSGTVRAVLVDVGGFLGMGDRSVAIPIDQIQPMGDRIVASGLTREYVEQLPEYKVAPGERLGSTNR